MSCTRCCETSKPARSAKTRRSGAWSAPHIRQRVAAIGRRVNTLCQGEVGLRDQLALFQVYHNFALPHASLRQPVLIPEATNDSGSVRLGRPCTPAMAVGLTH